MRKLKLFFLLAAVLMTAMGYAGTPEVYIQAEQLPHLLHIMPAPPAFDSPEFASDEVRYNWGKEQRQDSVRLAIAIADAEWNDLERVLNRWQEAFGMPISEATTPHIYALLVNSITTVDPMRIEPKAFYHRQRPFERYGDAMPSHEESSLRGEGSYPSGHSLRGWLIGLVLAQVAPERAEALLARSWDYCNSRVIVGAHWQSDVDNSRTAASVGFGALQTNDRFRAHLLEARKEYQSFHLDYKTIKITYLMATHPIYHGQWQDGSTILQKLDGPIGNGEVEYPNGDSFKGFFHLEWGSRSSEAYTANGRYTFADGAYIDEAWIKTGSKEYPFSLYGFYRIRQNDETRSFTMFRNGYKVGFELILGEHPTFKMWDEGVELTPDKALEVLSYELDDSKGEDELRLTIILKDPDGERKLIIQGGDLRQNSYGSYYYSPGYRVFVFEPNGDSREYGNNLPKNFQPYEGYITLHDAATGQCRYEVWENGQLDKAYDWNWDKQAARRVTLPHPLEEDKTLEALVWNGGHIVYQSSYYTYEGEIANDRPEGEGKLIYDDYDDDFHVYYGRFHDGRYCSPAKK